MKILVCTDGSKRSKTAFSHAARLASAFDAELLLVRVLDPRIDAAHIVTPSLDEAVASVRATWEDELTGLAAGFGRAARVLVPLRGWGEDVAQTIQRVASEQDADLVVIASRGAGPVRHALLGSVAMGVVSASSLPVMTVGAKAKPTRNSGTYHIVVTSDGSPDSRTVFEGIAALLLPEKTRVTLLQVVTPEHGESEVEAAGRCRRALVELRKRVPADVETAIEVRAVPIGGGIDTTITSAASELGAEVIASATHGHGARRHLVAGSTALAVMSRGPLPVILVKSRPVD
jgi:nucleotide-binding universal stress UspA family protein